MNNYNWQKDDAEFAVIGSLLVDNYGLHEIEDYLHADDFNSKLARETYHVIQNLLVAGKSADAICVSHFLVAEKRTNHDPFVDLCNIMNGSFTPKNIKYYAELVKQMSIDRKMLAVAQNMIVSVHEQKENRLFYAQQNIAELTNELPSDISLASDILNSVVKAIDERNTSQARLSGLATGYSHLDQITNGLHGGDLIILAGRPGMGKTLLAMNIAEHVALNEQKTVAVFSLEMKKNKLLERSLASIGSIESEQIKTGKLTRENFQKLFSIIPLYQKSKLFIDDRSFLRVADMRATCRRIQHEHGLSLVVIDYIGLMSAEGENETLRVTNISRGLKLLARDLNVPIIAISQLNRSVEQRNNKRPCMSDLRQSGAIEQDADLIFFIYRHDVYDQNILNKGIAEIIIAKHRNGEPGTVNLKFNNKICRFDNYTGDISNKAHADGQSESQPERAWSGKSLIY